MQCIGKREHCSLFPMHCMEKKGDVMMGKVQLTQRLKYYGYDNQEPQNYWEATADSAKEAIDPDAIYDAIENVKTTFDEQLKKVEAALKNITTEADQAQVVNGASMGPVIDETAGYIGGLGPTLYNGIDEIYTQAVKVYNELQEQLNKYAEDAVKGQGVSSPSSTVVA